MAPERRRASAEADLRLSFRQRSYPPTSAVSAAPAGQPAPEGVRRRMKKLIGVLDLASGTVANRRWDSLTLDIPSDLDWVTGGVSLDANSLGRYVARGGESRVYFGSPTHLARRAHGEECLVAAAEINTSGATCTRRYRVSMVEV
jgi:hypothetical protein